MYNRETITVTAETKKHLKSTSEVNIHMSESTTVQEQTSQMTVGHEMTLPGMYGSYSSHKIRIDVTLPAPADVLEGQEFDNLVSHATERIVTKQQEIMDSLADALGQERRFEAVAPKEEKTGLSGLMD